MSKRIKELIKKVLVSLVLISTLALGGLTINTYAANYGIQPFKLSESSIVREKNSKPKILLDLSHFDSYNETTGIKDNGAEYNGYIERVEANDITIKVRNLLIDKGYNVQMTRNINENKSISDRVKMANRGDYDFYLSIHLNSCENENTGTGSESYSVSAWSFSNQVLTRLESELGLDNRGIFESPYYNSRIHIKSALLELGFINNINDMNTIINNKDKIAEIIVDGIINSIKIN